MHVKLYRVSVILIAVIIALRMVTNGVDPYLGIALIVDAVLFFYLWNKYPSESSSMKNEFWLYPSAPLLLVVAFLLTMILGFNDLLNSLIIYLVITPMALAAGLSITITHLRQNNSWLNVLTWFTIISIIYPFVTLTAANYYDAYYPDGSLLLPMAAFQFAWIAIPIAFVTSIITLLVALKAIYLGRLPNLFNRKDTNTTLGGN